MGKNETFLAALCYNADGLIPIIVQDAVKNDILMMAWANREAIEKTLETGIMHYWSRSRGSLWRKGETSGHEQELVTLSLDCDSDTLLAQVNQKGGIACHTGKRSCFFTPVYHAGNIVYGND